MQSQNKINSALRADTRKLIPLAQDQICTQQSRQRWHRTPLLTLPEHCIKHTLGTLGVAARLGTEMAFYLARTSPTSWPGSSSGTPSKTRLAPPSAHTRSAAGPARWSRRPPAAQGKQGARQSATYASARGYQGRTSHEWMTGGGAARQRGGGQAATRLGFGAGSGRAESPVADKRTVELASSGLGESDASSWLLASRTHGLG